MISSRYVWARGNGETLFVALGYVLHEQRLDETETGEATTVTLTDTKRPPEWVKAAIPDDVAR